MQNRIAWLDAAKGIGIIFVVFYHMDPSDPMHEYLTSFLMPLFFFLSGYALNWSRHENPSGFVVSRIKSLLVPYLSYAIVLYGVWFLVTSHRNNGDYAALLRYSARGWLDLLRALFWGSPDLLARTIGNSPLWFLPSLFVAEILYYLIRQLSENVRYLFAALVAVSFAEHVNTTSVHLAIPFGGNAALGSVVFYGMGHMAREHLNEIMLPEKIYGKILVLLGALNLLLLSQIIAMNKLVTNGILSGYLFPLMNAFVGLSFYVMISSKVDQPRWLIFLGRNSLIIYVLNHDLLFLLSFILDQIPGVTIHHPPHLLLACVFMTVVLTLLALPFIVIINRFAPFLIGKGYAVKTA